jgi:ABC-type phosphate/phosphonate transport system substrate-binding protein
VFDRLAATDKRISRDLKVLARSPDVPENCLALKKDIDAPLRTSLLEALLNMHLDHPGQIVLKNLGVRSFIRTSDKDYAPVYSYSSKIGLNLATYDYIND